jgi:hypothetical protein
MPIISQAQRRAMWAAENGHSDLGIPKEVATKFLTHDFAALAANSAIPAGVRKLAVDADTAEDMTDEDWRGLIEGLVKFFSEEKLELAHDAKIVLDVDDEDGQLKKLLEYIKANSEVGHSFGVVVDPDDSELTKKFYIDGDGAFRIRDITMAMDRNVIERTFRPPPDSRFVIAMDKDSVREKTRDGRLIVHRTPISKANVCPYRGKEIPGWEELGLDPDRVYNLLRDPEELAKAAPTSNGVQLLIKHVPVNALEEDSHRPMETVGSVGSDAEFDGEYLYNSIFVNAKKAINGIETHKQRELSPGYHYTPDMTPGNFRGTAYDGVMRNIVFNHVCLVEDGRTGPDVLVADEALKEQDMTKATRFGARTLHMTAAAIAPLLAMDSKVTLPKDLFIPLTTKNFKDHRAKLMSGVKLALDGKLKKGIALDNSMEKFGKALDAFIDDVNSGMDEPAPEEANPAIEAASQVEGPKAITEQNSTYDAEPLKGFLRDCGMDEEKIAKCMDMMPKPGMTGDADETPEEKAAREKKEAADKTAKDNEMKDMVSKPAMDAALKAQSADFDKRVKAVRDSERAIRVALDEVRPWVGELPATMAFDSAADVHRKALEMNGDAGAKTLHADALMPILKTYPKIGARTVIDTGGPKIAMDAIEKATKYAPGLADISTQL